MNRRKLKNSITALLLICTMLLANGCGTDTRVSQAETVTISFSWWGNDDRNEYTLAAISHFEELYPNIKVDCHYTEWSGYQTRYNMEIMANTESDVMQINYAWLNTYSSDGNGYYDLNQLSDIIDLNNFDESDLEYGTVGDKLNAIPIALNTITLYANESIYKDYGLTVPQTWDDYFAAAKVMNGEAYPIGAALKPAFILIVAYVEQQTGKTFIDSDGNIGFGQEEIAMMLDFYKKLVEEKVMNQTEYFEQGDIANGTYAGFAAWISDGDDYCKDAISAGSDYTIAPYPGVSEHKDNTGWYAKPATMYAISDSTEHPEESALLLNYLLNSTDMAKYQGIEKGIPLSKTAQSYLAENDKLTGIQYDAYEEMTDHQESMNIISPYLENSDILSAFQTAFNDVLYEKSTAADRAVTLLKELNGIKK